MNLERWREVDKLLKQALLRPPEERAAFLDEACGRDAELRRDVEAVLQSHQQAGSLLNLPALETTAKEIVADQTQSLAGRMLFRVQRHPGKRDTNMYRIYEALHPNLKDCIEGLKIKHDGQVFTVLYGVQVPCYGEGLFRMNVASAASSADTRLA